MSHTVLVTDGEQRSALAVTRSLGAAGFHVIVGHTDPRAIAAASRYAARRVLLPSAEAEPEAWSEAVMSAVREMDIRAVVPVTEPSLLAALPSGLGDAVIAGPTYAAFEAIRDKESLLERAAGLGIATPSQHVMASPGEPPDLPYPLVVKPARSVFEEDGQRVKTGVQYARDAGHLRRLLADVPAAAYPVLLQEYIPGAGIGVFGLRWDGRRLATFAHRRLREKPPSGGVSVCSVSVDAPPELVASSWRLLESYDWRGPAMVEYKQAADGRAVLMEVNGRFWGSLQLALHAGVDFPALLVRAALGLPVTPVEDYRTGVRNHWEWGEVDAALIRWRKPDPVTGRREGLLRALADLVWVLPVRDRAEVFRLSDPLPFWRETLAWWKG